MMARRAKAAGEPVTYKFREGAGPISFREFPNPNIADPAYRQSLETNHVPLSLLTIEWRKAMQEGLEEDGMSFPGGTSKARADLIERFIAAGMKRDDADNGIFHGGADLKHPSSSSYAWDIWSKLDKAMSFWPQTGKHPPEEYSALGLAFQAGMLAAVLQLLPLDKLTGTALKKRDDLGRSQAKSGARERARAEADAVAFRKEAARIWNEDPSRRLSTVVRTIHANQSKLGVKGRRARDMDTGTAKRVPVGARTIEDAIRDLVPQKPGNSG